MARRGGAHAREASARLEEVRPFVAPGTTFDGMLLWTEALGVDAAGGRDRARVERLLDQAAERLRGNPHWSSWLADNRRRLAAAT